MLKPKKAEVYLIYECNCGVERQLSFKEVKHLKGFVCYSCDAYHKLENIVGIDITLKKSNPSESKNPKPQPTRLTEVQETAILGLVSLGFKNADAKDYVMKHQFNTVEEYLVNIGKK